MNNQPTKTNRCKVTMIEQPPGGGKFKEVECKNKATKKWHGCPVCQKHWEYLDMVERKHKAGEAAGAAEIRKDKSVKAI